MSALRLTTLNVSFAACLTIAGRAAAPNRIVFTHDSTSRAGVYVASSDGSEERPLFGSDALRYNPAWSPDGQWIAFTSEEYGSADLFRVKADGTSPERLTSDRAFDDQASWSPDGNRLVFVTTRAGGTADLWTLDVNTKVAKPLTSGRGADLRPSWSPDGNWIAFSSDRDRQVRLQPGGFVQQQLASVYVIRPDGSGLRRVTTTDDFCGSPAWAADSRSLVAACMSGADTVDYRVGTGPAPAGAGHT
jgi:Tol biopolymer transport system component